MTTRTKSSQAGAEGDIGVSVPTTTSNSPSTLSVDQAIEQRTKGSSIDPTFHNLEVQSLISGELVEVNGVMTSLSDSWSSNWNEETVYGRIDPIPTYSNTTRTISLGVDLVPLSSGDEKILDAIGAQAIVAKLVQMLYPAHESTTGWNGSVLKAPPLLQIRLNNVICGKDGGFLKAYLKSLSVVTEHDGLYSVVDVQQSSANFDFDNQVYYNRLSLSFDFGILHDFEIGHNKSGGIKNYSYPFNFSPPTTEG